MRSDAQARASEPAAVVTAAVRGDEPAFADAGDRIVEITAFDPTAFPAFGLPATR
jgi:hypothetical protein